MLANFGLGLIELLFVFPMFLLGIVGFIFWLWMLVDCVTNEPSEGNDKLIWVLIIVFTNLVGALVYFFIQRPRRKGSGGV
ncbi:MAG: PLDc_N domain-containing protein [Verrucomicrobiales bacterium]|nr:PLDc_N domain-containing protein [Verrucomicrobiales bacterium]